MSLLFKSSNFLVIAVLPVWTEGKSVSLVLIILLGRRVAESTYKKHVFTIALGTSVDLLELLR